MKRIILSMCITAVAALGAAGCSSKTTGASDTKEECQEAVGAWTALYDAYEAEATGKTPEQMAAVKVRDGARELRSTIEAACERDVATEVANANQEMVGVLDAINLCEFEKCDSKVADQTDKTMAAVDRVRSLVEK